MKTLKIKIIRKSELVVPENLIDDIVEIMDDYNITCIKLQEIDDDYDDDNEE